MQRRKFIRQATIGTSIVATGCLPIALARLLAPENETYKLNNYLRPPGALKNDLVFTEACTDFEFCAEVCPHPSLPIRIIDRSQGTVTDHRV